MVICGYQQQKFIVLLLNFNGSGWKERGEREFLNGDVPGAGRKDQPSQNGSKSTIRMNGYHYVVIVQEKGSTIL